MPEPALAIVVPVPYVFARAGAKLIPLPAPRMVVPAGWAEASAGETVMPEPGDATTPSESCALVSAGVTVIPVPGWERSSTGEPLAWTMDSGVVRVSPDPLAPAVPTVWTVLVSWFVPV